MTGGSVNRNSLTSLNFSISLAAFLSLFMFLPLNPKELAIDRLMYTNQKLRCDSDLSASLSDNIYTYSKHLCWFEPLYCCLVYCFWALDFNGFGLPIAMNTVSVSAIVRAYRKNILLYWSNWRPKKRQRLTGCLLLLFPSLWIDLIHLGLRSIQILGVDAIDPMRTILWRHLSNNWTYLAATAAQTSGANCPMLLGPSRLSMTIATASEHIDR